MDGALDLRGGIAAVSICLLIALIDYQPRPVKDNQIPYCMQPVWDRYGRTVGGHWVPCNILDRYENA